MIPGASRTIRWPILAVSVACIAVVVLIAVGTFLRWQPPAGEQPRTVYRACQSFVTSRLDTWTTADFPETADVVPLALPFEAIHWRVWGTFIERTGASPPIRRTYVCDASTDGKVVKVLGVTYQDEQTSEIEAFLGTPPRK
jgi:hypothetical protein